MFLPRNRAVPGGGCFTYAATRNPIYRTCFVVVIETRRFGSSVLPASSKDRAYCKLLSDDRNSHFSGCVGIYIAGRGGIVQ